MITTRHILWVWMMLSTTCFAAPDEWVAKKLDNGETVYSSGNYTRIFLGSRGFGFATRQTLYDESVYVVIDDGKPILSPITTVGPSVATSLAHVYLFKNSRELSPLVARAKTLEIRLESCGTNYAGQPLECMFSKSGEPYSASWEFEKPLGELYRAN